ncbi:MAG TPA: fatty acid desaturase [Lacipirellulaceae bacterium]|nr:fatty acid desaturase [Lacipirellulaceae bacterium]
MSQAVATGGAADLDDDSSGEFSLAEARRIVGDFFRPNPWIYWTDFLVSWSVGMACYALVMHPGAVAADPAWHWPISIGAFVVSGLLIYRCSLFIHELVHIRADDFRAFRFVWNLLCGIPFLIPSFVYYTHIDHHRRKHYGTKEDGEYVPLATMPAWQILAYLSQIFVIPVLAIVRWGLLTPLTWVSPRLRDWVHRHASSMIMDPKYIRPLPTNKVRRMMRLQEFCCFAFIWAIVARMTINYGILFDRPLSPWFVVQAYLTGVFIVGINALRTLGAHRWTHDGSREMTFVEQMLDSVNYSGNPLVAGLWAPIGLRFHALHHIFPTMPYHALATAHRRLMANLPADSPYRQTEAKSLLGVIGTLWRRAKASERGQGAEWRIDGAGERTAHG